MDFDGNYFYLNECSFTFAGNLQTVYNLRINVNNGRVVEISYDLEEMDRSIHKAFFFYEYDQTCVNIPKDGEGDQYDDPYGDVVEGGESNDKENGYDNVVDNGYGNVVDNGYGNMTNNKVNFN